MGSNVPPADVEIEVAGEWKGTPKRSGKYCHEEQQAGGGK